jgi:UDP-N-acetylmuramyl pentapeptide phosphotransferase/UDP-N-acetylglucosamine-1-phosphate transferase
MKLNLFQYLLILFVVAIAAFSITPALRKFARKAKLLDYPGGRKLQSHPVAYLGGLAVATPITLGSLLVIFTSIPIDLKNQFFFQLSFITLIYDLNFFSLIFYYFIFNLKN